MAIIGIMGRKRSGKDTFASVLVNEAGYTRVAFADPLREVALATNPIVAASLVLPVGLITAPHLREVIDALGWERAKDYVPEVRGILPRLGRAVRGQDPDFWLDMGLRSFNEASGPVVVTDVRFPNEADAIRASGGRLVRIVRPGQLDDDADESEHALDDYEADTVVVNDAGIDKLEAAARIVALLT